MLAHRLHSLPPILHITHRGSLPGCSKGAQGLSVYMRVTGIFTGATDSLSLSWRQSPDRYAIRAGRNLPDKEFRYLRTVIVTAAVYRGFDSELRLRLPLLLTFRHRAGVRPYTSFLTLQSPVFLVNSRLGHFSATVQSFRGEPLHSRRHTFSRSYGANLPSSFTRDHSSALGFSPRLPVSVYGTVSVLDPHRGFSWQHGFSPFMARGPRDAPQR
jgi:hypothetical protein